MATKVQTTVQNALGSALGWVRGAGARDDRLSYLWLALGLALYPFATPRWTIPVAAWLVPIFWLRFVRTQPVLRGTWLVLLASALVLAFEMQGVVPVAGAAYYLFLAGPAVLGVLPYLIDRLVTPRRGGLPGGLLESLVFPLGTTTVAYLAALLSPNGSFGNLASTQYGDLPLLQLLSVTGLWGIIFLMSWFASLVNWAWEHEFAWPQVRGGTLLYAGLLALVLLFGGTRLAVLPAQAQGDTVRVAGISPSRALSTAASQQFSRQVPAQAWMTLMMSRSGTRAERDRARAAVAPVFARVYAPVNDDLLARSEQQARAGAKIIAWPEAGAQVLQEDQPALLARAGALARATGVYLDMGIGVLLEHPGPSGMLLDQVVLIDPAGNIVWRYEKTHLVPGAETGMVVPGVDRVPSAQTPYGRLSNVVCFDGDFQGTMRQAGQAGADIMLVPSNDWREIDPIHSQMIALRAIENGYSLVRSTSNGLALTVDYQGRVLAASDYFTADSQVMVADVPVKGARTIYATIGDLFAWLAIAGLLALIASAVAQRRGARAGGASPGASQPTGRRLPALSALWPQRRP